MQQIVDLVLFAGALGVILTLLFMIYKVKRSKDALMIKLFQAYVDNDILSEQISKLVAEKDANALKEDDGFIKFLSSSRDWAFSYIEDTQDAIQKFKDKAGPPIQKLSGSRSADIKLIIEAYNSLVEVLPDENNKGK